MASSETKERYSCPEAPTEKADSSGKVKPASQLEKPVDEYTLYVNIRTPADDAMSEGEYSRARALYVRGAQKIEEMALERDNRLSAMYAGAASCARACNRYLLSINHLQQAFEHLKENDYWFIQTLSYVVDQIHALPYYIKTAKQKKLLNRLMKEMFEKFKSHIEKIPPPTHPLSKPHSYELQQESIRDDFQFLEDMHSDDSKNWLKAEKEYSRSFFQLALLNYELPSEYFRSDRQQPNLIPFRYGKYYYFRHVDQSTRHRSIKRAEAASAKKKLILSGERVCPTGHFITGERISENGEFISTLR